MKAVAHCKACGAEIVWAKTTNGKAMPLDARPERRAVSSLDPDDFVVQIVLTWMPHWTTCPQADQFRKK